VRWHPRVGREDASVGMGNKPSEGEAQNGRSTASFNGASGKKGDSFFGMPMKSKWKSLVGGSSSSSSAPVPLGPEDEDEGRIEPCESLLRFIEDDLESETDEDSEEHMEPHDFLRPRRGAVSAEATGVWNPRRAGHSVETFEKTAEQKKALKQALKACPFLSHLDEEGYRILVDVMPIEEVAEGTKIIQQGDYGDVGYVIISGSGYILDEDGKHHIYNQDEFSPDQSTNFHRITDEINVGEENSSQRQRSSKGRRGSMAAGRFFGEIAMLWGVMRTVSIFAAEKCVLAKLDREAYTNVVIKRSIAERDIRQECLRRAKLLETLNDEQIGLLADALELRAFDAKDEIIEQGTWGHEFFVVQSGECSATVRTVYETGRSDEADVQEHRRYGPGELFGENAVLQRTYRAATVTALVPTEVLVLSRRKFERLLGPLDALGAMHYLTDPRKCIADFYRKGDPSGPHGSQEFSAESQENKQNMLLGDKPMSAFGSLGDKPAGVTDWFCVYRPTSRDAISKMLSGDAVGKGLNIKGKSAKGGRLSGYVPFLQIHDNSHKKDIEVSPPDARVRIFYGSEFARETALAELQSCMNVSTVNQTAAREVAAYNSHKSKMGYAASEVIREPVVRTPRAKEGIIFVDDFAESSKMYGLEVPETAMRQAYIEKPDLSFLAGWETGRNSEPAFMDMNLHAVRGSSEPEVVLYQVDKDNPLNPQGLLIAYAEAKLKPVVSDFDTFLVGSRGMIYEELPPEQAKLASWALDHTVGVLKTPNSKSWNSRWLEVLKAADEEGFHPQVPKYGFGDAASYRLTSEVISATIESGAVRHGAECFNFFFPQELDDEYLIVWEHFPDKPWNYLPREGVRKFLLERASEGYSFPLNPVWPVRDPGWFEVLEALQNKVESCINLSKWFGNQDDGLMAKIKKIHEDYPDGFCKVEAKPKLKDKLTLAMARGKVTRLLSVVKMMDVKTKKVMLEVDVDLDQVEDKLEEEA